MLQSLEILEYTSLSDQVISHEMAHTWWGDLVASYGEGSKFLTESMAQFSSCYALSHLATDSDVENPFISQKRHHFCYYIALATRPKLYPLIQQEGYDAAKVTKENYLKGSLVVNQIRLTLGDEVFFRCLKAFITKYKGQMVNIYDFIGTINQLSKRDMTADMKNMLWTAGYPSYRLAGFESAKGHGVCRTRVRIQNEGEYGLICPVLLKMKGAEKREMFRVDGKDEREFVFTTDDEVIDVVIDPDLTAFHYHPQQRARLWMSVRPEGDDNWSWYGKSYMYYLLGDYQKAIDTITEYFSRRMKKKKYNNTEELADGWSVDAAYLFMRGIYYLALDDRKQAEKDIKTVFPRMLEMPKIIHYCHVGAIADEDMDQYLELLKLIARRGFIFETGLDEEAKKRKIEEWKQWWEKEGKYQELDLRALKKRFIGYDAAKNEVKRAPTVAKRALKLGIPEGIRERTRDDIAHIGEGLVLDMPDVQPLCGERDIAKRQDNL